MARGLPFSAEARLRFWLLIRDERLSPTAAGAGGRRVADDRLSVAREGWRCDSCFRQSLWATGAGGDAEHISVVVGRAGGDRVPEGGEAVGRAIAGRIGRADPTTISRELRPGRRRRSWPVPGLGGAGRGGPAGPPTEAGAGWPPTCRCASRCRTRLEQNHSPRADRRRLRRWTSPTIRRCGCRHETIYQSLYVQGRGALRRELTTHACAPGGRCANRAGAPMRAGGRIPDMVNDQRTPRRGRRPGGARALGRRPDHRRDRAARRSAPWSSAPPGSSMLLHLPDGHTAPTPSRTR